MINNILILNRRFPYCFVYIKGVFGDFDNKKIIFVGACKVFFFIEKWMHLNRTYLLFKHFIMFYLKEFKSENKLITFLYISQYSCFRIFFAFSLLNNFLKYNKVNFFVVAMIAFEPSHEIAIFKGQSGIFT